MSIKITISGDGLHFEGDTTLFKASQVIAFLGTENDIVTQQPYQSSFTNAVLDKPKLSSPREALIASKAKTNAQKIAVIGKYLMDRDSVDSFSAKEVRETLKKSGEPLPANFSRDIADSVKFGYIYHAGKNRDQYAITEVANEKITAGFGNDESVLVSNKSSKKRKKSPGISVAVRDEIKSIDIPDSFKGVTFWNDGLNKGERILWLLAIADEKGVSELFSQEIAYLASKMKDDIPAKNVPSLVDSHFKKTRIKITNNGSFQLLKSGFNHIENIKVLKKDS